MKVVRDKSLYFDYINVNLVIWIDVSLNWLKLAIESIRSSAIYVVLLKFEVTLKYENMKSVKFAERANVIFLVKLG